MKFMFATNEIVLHDCKMYRKELRYYEYPEIADTDSKDPNTEVHPGMRPLHHSYKCYADGTFVVSNYYLMPGNKRITDEAMIDILDNEAHYQVEYYIVFWEWCLRTPDNNMIRVTGYEKRRECDDVTVLYEERHVKNSSDPQYPVGTTLYSLENMEKVKCIGCCQGSAGDNITIN